MKKLKIFSALMLGSLLTAKAQDTYWALAGNNLYNTSTHAVTALPESSYFNFYSSTYNVTDNNVVFDKNGNVMLTGGPISNLAVYTSAPHLLGQIFPVANGCQQYLCLEDIAILSGGYRNQLNVTALDASAVTSNSVTTGVATLGSMTTLYDAQEYTNFATVAAPMNADGSRYIYHLYNDGTHQKIDRYTIAADGTVGTSATTITSTAVAGGWSYYGGIMKISKDGNTLAYISSTGSFVTYYIPTGLSTTYSTFNSGGAGYAVGIEQAGGGTSRRWFLTTTNGMGFVNEGSASSYTTLTDATHNSAMGKNSMVALGKDGNVYFAYSSAGAGNASGQLYYFNPGSTTITNFSTSIHAVTSASIAATYVATYNTIYDFGNHVSGEDICQAGNVTTAPTFTVAGQTQTGTPPQIWICPTTTTLPLALTMNSYYTSYSIFVEEGSYSGGIFTPTGGGGGSGGGSYTGPYAHVINKDLFPYIAGLNSYNGYIRVTVTTYGACGNPVVVSQIFQLQVATATVDFNIVGLYTCVTSQPRTLTPTFTSFTQPVTGTPPCYPEWLGAYTCGLTNASIVVTNGYPSYTVTIDKYDATGATWISNVATVTNPGSVPFSLLFNSAAVANGYFTTNYASIKNNNAFKVTLTANTTSCGAVSAYSWFKIIDGNSGWKTTEVPNEPYSDNELSVYPNPATTVVNMEWYGADNQNAYLEVFDVLGKNVYKSTMHETDGPNKASVDITNLPSGIYMYKLSCEKGNKAGRFQKI